MMAIVSSVPAMMQPAEPIRYPDISDMASFGEIVVEPVARVIQDMIYVTVGTSLKESKSNLIWTLQNSGGKRVCIVHVHQPAQMIPMSKSVPYSTHMSAYILFYHLMDVTVSWF